MTQQEMSQLLDVPDRTLRDWKKGRERLYTFNCFWQTNKPSKQKVYSIISNYLGTMNKIDIFTLCEEYGKNMIKSVLTNKYKKMYELGYISTKSMDIPLNGTYNTNETYKKILGILNDY